MRTQSFVALALCVVVGCACNKQEFQSRLGNEGGNEVVEASVGRPAIRVGTSRAGASAVMAGAGGISSAAQAYGGAGAPGGGAAGLGAVAAAGLASRGGSPAAGGVTASSPSGNGSAGAPRVAEAGAPGSAGDGGAVPAQPGGAGGLTGRGGRGGTPECTPALELCNGVDDDCDGLVDRADADSGVPFGFSSFEDVADTSNLPAHLEVVFAESAQRYAVLWVPIASPAGDVPPTRLYLLDAAGSATGWVVELPEVLSATGEDYRPRLATNGKELAVVWSSSPGSLSTRLLVIDAESATRVGEVVDLGGVFAPAALDVSVVSDGRGWFVAGRSGVKFVSMPIILAHVVGGTITETRQLESFPGSTPRLAAAGATLGLTWVRGSDSTNTYDETLFSFGRDLDELTDPQRFVSLGGGSQTNDYLVAGSSTHFTLAPVTPGLPLKRFDLDGTETCNVPWPATAPTFLQSLTTSMLSAVAIAELSSPTGTGSLAVVEIAEDCEPTGTSVIADSTLEAASGLDVAVGSEGALLVRSDAGSLSVARATASFCAPQ